MADQIKTFQGSRITQPRLLRRLARRNLQFKQLDQPQPALECNPQLAEPSSRKVMKRIATSFTTIPFADNPVDFIAVTAGAKNTAIFPTLFSKVQPSSILGFKQFFKAFNVHQHHYNPVGLVPKRL